MNQTCTQQKPLIMTSSGIPEIPVAGSWKKAIGLRNFLMMTVDLQQSVLKGLLLHTLTGDML